MLLIFITLNHDRRPSVVIPVEKKKLFTMYFFRAPEFSLHRLHQSLFSQTQNFYSFDEEIVKSPFKKRPVVKLISYNTFHNLPVH